MYFCVKLENCVTFMILVPDIHVSDVFIVIQRERGAACARRLTCGADALQGSANVCVTSNGEAKAHP